MSNWLEQCLCIHGHLFSRNAENNYEYCPICHSAIDFVNVIEDIENSMYGIILDFSPFLISNGEAQECLCCNKTLHSHSLYKSPTPLELEYVRFYFDTESKCYKAVAEN